MGSVNLFANLPALLAANVAMQNAIMERSEEILEKAKDFVPVRTGALHDTGRIFFTHEAVGGGIVGHVVFGGGGVDYAIYVEFGTSDTPAFAFLRRAGGI